MTVAKTGAEHIASLQDGRTVYIDGKLVRRRHHASGVPQRGASAAALYDYQAQPENIEHMTFPPDGSDRRVNRCWQMPRSYDETGAAPQGAAETGPSCTCGFMGRSPDHVASALVGQRMGIDVFRRTAQPAPRRCSTISTMPAATICSSPT